MRVARTKPSNSDFFTTQMADFIQTFGRIVVPPELPHLFFIEGGALAVENAMKVAFDWKVRLNMARGERSEKGTQILHFKQAFHGRTGYTLSVTNTADPRKTKYFPKFPWPRVTNPKIVFPLEGENLKSVGQMEGDAEAEIRSAFTANPNDIAAILIEPIQGEGGDNHFRPEFHQKLRQLADEYEAMLIYDEVQTGIGLTGKMWAYQHYGIVPDIVCFGKKTQVCGIMVGRRVEQAENNVFVEASRINSTWGGNLVDMVRCQRYLEIIEEERLVDNARVVGDELLGCLHEIQGRHGDVMSNVRGLGLMCAFDLHSGEKRDQFWRRAFDRGVLLLRCGETSIRVRPPLTFGSEDVAELVGAVEEIVVQLR